MRRGLFIQGLGGLFKELPSVLVEITEQTLDVEGFPVNLLDPEVSEGHGEVEELVASLEEACAGHDVGQRLAPAVLDDEAAVPPLIGPHQLAGPDLGMTLIRVTEMRWDLPRAGEGPRGGEVLSLIRAPDFAHERRWREDGPHRFPPSFPVGLQGVLRQHFSDGLPDGPVAGPIRVNHGLDLEIGGRPAAGRG